MNKIFGLDLRSLGFFRILLGLTLLFDLFFNKILYYEELYSINNGFQGSTFLNSSLFKDSVFGFIQTNSEMPLLLFLALISYIFFILGFIFRYSKVFATVLYIYISQFVSLVDGENRLFLNLGN